MSQLFKNYDSSTNDIANNEKEYIDRLREYKDVIVLGADNDHTFRIPYTKDELIKFTITYIQGTEIKLQYTFFTDKFIKDDIQEELNETEEDDVYTPLYISYTYRDDKLGSREDGAKLYEMNDLELAKMFLEYEDGDNVDEEIFEPIYSVLFYNLSAEDSLLFNDYNKEVFVQLKAFADINEDTGHRVIRDYSRMYKLQIRKTIDKEDLR